MIGLRATCWRPLLANSSKCFIASGSFKSFWLQNVVKEMIPFHPTPDPPRLKQGWFLLVSWCLSRGDRAESGEAGEAVRGKGKNGNPQIF